MWPFEKKRIDLTAPEPVAPWLTLLARVENGTLLVLMNEHGEVFRHVSEWPVSAAAPSDWRVVGTEVKRAAHALAGEKHWHSIGECYTLHLAVRRGYADALLSWGRKKTEWGFWWPDDPKGPCGQQFEALERLRDAIMATTCRRVIIQADERVAYG